MFNWNSTIGEEEIVTLENITEMHENLDSIYDSLSNVTVDVSNYQVVDASVNYWDNVAYETSNEASVCSSDYSSNNSAKYEAYCSTNNSSVK